MKNIYIVILIVTLITYKDPNGVIACIVWISLFAVAQELVIIKATIIALFHVTKLYGTIAIKG